MHTSRFARRRHRLTAVVVGLCLAGGSVGTAALADSGSGSGATVTIDAGVVVQAGVSPINARRAAAELNSAIDLAARSIARSGAAAFRSGRPLRTTAAATTAFAHQVDAALSDFVVQTLGGLQAAGVATEDLLEGTLAALNRVVRIIPGAVAVTTGVEIALVGGADSTKLSAALNPVIELALRRTLRATVDALGPVLPLAGATVQAVAAGVSQVVEALVVLLDDILTATVDLVGAVLGVTLTTLQSALDLVGGVLTGLDTIVAGVTAALDTLTDMNLSAAVDAGLAVSAG